MFDNICSWDRLRWAKYIHITSDEREREREREGEREGERERGGGRDICIGHRRFRDRILKA